MSYVATIDEGSCIAQGDCAELAPDVFEVDDCARIVGSASDDVLLAAASNCPTQAIAILDRQTGEQVYP